MERAPTSALPANRQFNVLVIDDSEVDCELTTRHLGHAWPFEHEMAVTYAATGPEALDTLRRQRFTLIVLDWKLPGLGGGELLQQLRHNGVRIPVVVLSGLKRAAIAEDLKTLGAAFLNKDELNPLTLHRAIAESLQLLGRTQPAASSTAA